MNLVAIEGSKVADLLETVKNHCNGPEEAFALLCLTIVEVHKINNIITGQSATLTDLSIETSNAIISIGQLQNARPN